MKNPHIFETITPTVVDGRWNRPQATLNAKGRLKINRVAHEMLGEPERVHVLFNKATQTIALKAADKHDTQTHVLIDHGKHGRHGGRLIRINGLMEQIEGEIYTCVRFRDIKLDPHGRLILDLKDATPAFNGTRIGAYTAWKRARQEHINETKRASYERRQQAATGLTREERAADAELKRAAHRQAASAARRSGLADREEEFLVREDRETRTAEARGAAREERQARHERERERKKAERAAAKDARKARDLVEVPNGLGGTIRVTKKIARDLERLRPIYEKAQREKYGDDWQDAE